MTRFYNTLAALAVILTPVAMMAAFGWNAYAAILAQTGSPPLAALSGIATAAAVEAIGIVAGETALSFHGRHDPRWRTAAAVLILYVAAGLTLLWKTPLAPLPLLAGAVYILVGLRAQAEREIAVANDHAAASTAWQREQWRIRQSDKTRLKLAELEHKASTEPAPNDHMPTQSGHICDGCGREFASVQALNAHQRFCKARHEAPAIYNEAVS